MRGDTEHRDRVEYELGDNPSWTQLIEEEHQQYDEDFMFHLLADEEEAAQDWDEYQHPYDDWEYYDYDYDEHFDHEDIAPQEVEQE